MNIKVLHGNITTTPSDAAIVNLFEGVTRPAGATGAVDSAIGGLISTLIDTGEITGKRGNSVLIHTPSKVYDGFTPSRVLVVGLGPGESFGWQEIRDVSASAVKKLGKIAETVTTIVHGAGIGGMNPQSAAAALAEGSTIGAYSFNKYKNNSDRQILKTLNVMAFDPNQVDIISAGVDRGRLFGESQNMARDLVNEPANHLSPSDMAGVAVEIAESLGLQIKIFQEEECNSMGMGAFIGVAQGSSQPAKFVHITHNGDPDNINNNIWLIGKSITFDSGGISLKPARSMGNMKGDMGGGAAVLGAMRIIGEMKPRVNVHAVLPITENMPDGNAQRPGDVVKSMSGKFIEIDNTDAEGRLTLADAIDYAHEHGARRIVDVATLTGAARIALGTGNSAVFGNDESLMNSLITSANSSGERMWRLPLDAASKRQNRSRVADLKNSGGAAAGSITAAHFIAEFAGDTPWVHMDIAATSMLDAPSGMFTSPGATGVATRTLAELAINLSA